MKKRTYFLMVIGVAIVGNWVHALEQHHAALVAGAAALNNGGVVTLGQPFVGTTRTGDNSVTFSLGLLPTLGPRTNSTPFTISPSVRMDHGRFTLGFFIEPGRRWIAEGSTNLTDWSPLWTDLANEPWVEFEDFTTSLFQYRFYRVRYP